jgi:RHS repeat-associated protein
MGCLKLTYSQNNATLKVAYSVYGKNQNNYTSSYRYGFNGKENDRETVSTGEGTQDYGMRIYNPALGKFLSVDPLTKEYPYYTPYQFAGNKPIAAIDLDGEEESIRIILTINGKTHITKIPWNKLYPGQEHGSKGTGTLDYTKDEKTGKWDKGRYVKSFADVNPVKAFFGSEYSDRYSEKKGLKQLGKDAAPVIGTTGKVIKYIGYGLSVTPFAECSPVLIGAGNGLETFADGLEVVNEVVENGVTTELAKDVAIKVTLDYATGGLNKQIDKSDISEKAKKGAEIYNEVKKDVVDEVLTNDQKKEDL